MAVESGLYSIKFKTDIGEGHGVAFLANGRIHGGDSVMAYVGHYKETGSEILAKVRVFRYVKDNAMQSVLGVDEADIQFSGHVAGYLIKLTGESEQARGVSLHAAMEKIQD